ncbi:hypothetical protein QTP88_002170 [Uroleucon formosanum]
MDLWNLPTTEKDAVAFFQEKGILPYQRICSNGHKAKLYFGKQVFWKERENKKIGGKGKILEIDESLFTKRKNNCGRVLPQQWIFGGICRETKEVFLVEVSDRSYCWRAYNAILDNGYEHFTVNHSSNFVDPSTHAHTQGIERLWGSAKWRNKRHRGTARHHLESYLAEFMWRNTYHNEDKFKVLLNSIANHWPSQNDF